MKKKVDVPKRVQCDGQMSTLYANRFSRTLCNSARDLRPSGKRQSSYKDIGIEVSLMIPRRDLAKDISLQNLNSLPNGGHPRLHPDKSTDDLAGQDYTTSVHPVGASGNLCIRQSVHPAICASGYLCKTLFMH
jgi:hypothetical protein